MRLMKRIIGAGLGAMGAVALAAAIWPPVAGVVTGLLVTLLVTVLCAAGGLAVLGGRRVRARLARRRELRTRPALDAEPYRDAAGGATPIHLRNSA